MKNIFVQNTYNKFINNLHYVNLPEVKFHFNTVNNNLYKLHFNDGVSNFIFSASSMNNEIISFTDDSSVENINVFIYHDIYNEYLIKIMSKYKHIVDEDDYNELGIKFDKNIINSSLYFNNPNITKKDRMILFLEKKSTIPESIKDFLHRSDKKILMFNNSEIIHDQNIGFLSELNRSEVLQESSYFICDNGYYGLEAQLCGCKILDIDDISKDITDNYDCTKHKQYVEFIGEMLV
jgi:hypothetical protein